MKIHYRLFHKTFLSTLLLFICIIVVSHLTLFFTLPILYKQNIQDDLQQHASTIQSILENDTFQDASTFLESYTKQNNLNILVEYDNQIYSYNTNAISINTFMDEDQLDITENDSAELILLLHQTITLKDASTIKMQYMQTLQPIKQARDITLSLLPFSILISFCISFIFAYFYSRSITRPIEKMVQVTEVMQQLDGNATIPYRGNDELSILSVHINTLYQKLIQTIHTLEEENAYVKQVEKEKVNFFRAASHDLKTPLANTRIMLENMLYEIGKYKDHPTYLKQAIQQIDTINAMLQTMLTTSKQYGELQSVSIKDTVDNILQEYTNLIEAKQLHIQIEMDTTPITINPQQLHHLLTNLLSNALYYSDTNGFIRIHFYHQTFTIENSCTPLSKDALQHVFEPFYRMDASRNSNGNGLGLYIVKTILDSLEYPYSFEAKQHSMCFTITFVKK